MSSICRCTTFFVERLHFGIEVERVQEVLQPPPTTRVPGTERVIGGLVNLRGQILVVIDLRARLDLPPRLSEQASISLIVRTNDGLVCLRVDALGEVLDYDMSEDNGLPLDSLPDTVKGPMRTLVTGIWKLEKSLLFILDPDRLIETEICLT